MRGADTLTDAQLCAIREEVDARCTQVADTVVPAYREAKKDYCCTGSMAKRWQAAWDAACVVLGHDPSGHRLFGAGPCPACRRGTS